jgi:hypothetical protein
MNALDLLNAYLQRAEKRLRWKMLGRGVALACGVALLATLVLVSFTNAFAFSESSVFWARVILFVSVALAVTFGLVVPQFAINKRNTAKEAEKLFPEFQQSLLTFADKADKQDPFLELVAGEAHAVASQTQSDRFAPVPLVAGLWVAGTFAALALLWMITSGPGYWGHGASLLWAGAPKSGVGSAFYDILVSPGNKTVRRRSDQVVSAQLVGFDSTRVRLKAKYDGTSKWEEVPMMPQQSGAGYEFLFASLPTGVEYYVEANGIRSKSYQFKVIDLPNVKKLKVTYQYPSWTGMKEFTEDPGGDLRAVEGTVATITVETDQPLKDGIVMLESGERIPLSGSGTTLSAKVNIQKDGLYHLAVQTDKEQVRLSDDYFIEARKDNAPNVRLRKPGKDAKVSPIEEVGVLVEADDDFGLQDLSIHYTVNGGEEKHLNMLGGQRGVKTAEGKTLIALEDFNLKPGDVIGIYASAKDARATTQTDIFFIEAQPFEKSYSQSQQMGGGGGGGQQEREEQISRRQKEIIAATWNEVRKPSGAKEKADIAKFLSEMESKLRDQAKMLSQRVKARQLAGTNDEFKFLVKEIDGAVQELSTAADKLRESGFKEALAPEQKALQHILRVEESTRDIQVAFGNRGGGGGGGAGRDLENLFDLELDTEKNQYETGQKSSAEQRQKEVDEAAQRLEQLARRQQELAQQQQKQGQSFQQKWQQELLRREAEELQKKLQEMTGQQQQQQGQQSSQQQQGGQSGQQSGSSSSGRQGQQGQQQGQQQQQQQSASSRSPMQRQQDQQLQQTLDRLKQAVEDMRRSAQSPEQAGAGSRRAAERLQEAQDALKRMRREESQDAIGNAAQQAEQLAQQQSEFEKKMRETFGRRDGRSGAAGQDRAKAEELAQEKEKIFSQLDDLERKMQKAVQNMAGTQPKASSQVREALGDLQQSETKLRMKRSSQWIRGGQGQYLMGSEQAATQNLERLRDQLRGAQQALDPNAKSGDKDQQKAGAGTKGERDVEQALERVERMRSQLQQLMRNGQGQQSGGQQGQQQQQGQGQQQGQSGQLQRNGQGQQPGQQGQQQQGQGGQQQGGQQQGGQQQGGQQGGQQSGGGDQRGGMNRGNRGAGGLGGGIWNGGNLEGGRMPGDVSPERALREASRDMAQLRQALRDNPELQREFADVFQELQKMDFSKLPQGPELEERLRRQVMPNIEALELMLRRKLEESRGGQVRNAASERPPDGYAEKVADYFRRLSKGK